MGRPSVAHERRRQIAQATIDCIAAHGISGATLERIAETAGMARGHIRHFVGNRDQVLIAAARTFYFDDADDGSILPADVGTLTDILDFLFGADFTAPGPDNTVSLGFVEASRTLPEIRQILLDAYLGAQSGIAAALADEIPGADETVRAHTAYGILMVALGNVFMSDIEISVQRTRDARTAADALVASLRSDTDAR